MREIKFRGKRIDNGGCVYGTYFQGEKWNLIITQMRSTDFIHQYTTMEAYEVDPATVGQYTGITKNKEVYEGDICDTHTRFGKGVVVWESEMFKINGISLCTFSRIEVLGNIHENPELLVAQP